MRHIPKRATPLLLALGLVGSLTATTPALADQKTDHVGRGPAATIARIVDMEIGTFETFIWFQLDYPGELGGNYPPVYRDIVFSDITVASAKTRLDIHGPADAPLSDVTLRDVTVEEVETPMVLENVQDLRFDNVRFGDQYVDGELDWLS